MIKHPIFFFIYLTDLNFLFPPIHFWPDIQVIFSFHIQPIYSGVAKGSKVTACFCLHRTEEFPRCRTFCFKLWHSQLNQELVAHPKGKEELPKEVKQLKINDWLKSVFITDADPVWPTVFLRLLLVSNSLLKSMKEWNFIMRFVKKSPCKPTE